MEEDETRYCSLVDKIFQQYPELGKALTDNCLSGAAARKAMIIPKKIKGITKEELMQHILYKPYTYEFLLKMDGKYIKSISGHRFVIKSDGKKVELNDVEITKELTVGPEKHQHELFSIKSALVTLPPQTPEEKEAYRKMKEEEENKGENKQGGGSKKKIIKKKKHLKKKYKGGDIDPDDDGSDYEENESCSTCGGVTKKKKYKSFLEVLDSDEEEGGEGPKKNMVDSLVF